MKTWNVYYKKKAEFSLFVQAQPELWEPVAAHAILVQVFCGYNDMEYIKQVSAEISDVLPRAYVIGTTTAGEIVNGEVSGLETVVSITAFHDTDILAGCFKQIGQDDFILGQEIALALFSPNAKVMLLFGAGDKSDASKVLEGIAVQNPKLLISGGNAGKSYRTNPSVVFYGKRIIKNGYVAVVLVSNTLQARVYSHLGWQGIGKKMTITRAHKNRVYTINNIPAYQVYRRYLGIDKSENFLNVMEFPLLISREDILLARTPTSYYDDDSLGFAGECRNGDVIRLSFGDAGLIVEMILQLCRDISKEVTESIFIYSCESRRGFLQDLSDIETKPLQNIAPTAGFFTLGEYYHVRDKNYLLNATMTVLAMAEKQQEELHKQALLPELDAELAKELPGEQDSVSSRRKGVLKTLTHLISVVTKELEVANHNLYYMGMHDSLTGLYNRAFFEPEMKRLEELDDAIGILICDMDYLKLINDSLGHEIGDKMLKQLATVLKQACSDKDVVARIGGDEFVLLVPRATPAELTELSEKIIADIQQIREASKTAFLYASLGTSYRPKGSKVKLSKIFVAADKAMYQHKVQQRDSVKAAVIQELEKMKCQVVDARKH